MAFDFPNSPIEGQIYAPPGGLRYKFQAQVWDVIGSATGQELAQADTYWPSRATLVASIAGGMPVYDGKLYTAGEYGYIGSTGATVIPDLPGLVPMEPANIAHFGGALDGSANALIAVLAMGAWAGFATVPKGNFRIDTGTIDYPLFFDPGGYFTVNAGQTLTITERITSSRQWIFRGAGAVLVNVQSGGDSGEDARVLHVSWFGAFPRNTAVVDQVPFLTRAYAAFAGQTREGILEYDQGTYRVHSALSTPRGIHTKGVGSRRTVFDVVGSGYDVFTTADVACKFSGIQFEQPSGSVAYRTGALIKINHDDCEVEDFWGWCSEFGIVVNGKDCAIHKVRASYPVGMPAGTALIQVNASGCTVDGVKINTDPNGPTALVQVKGTAAIGQINISNVQTNAPSIPVLINPAVGIVSRVNVDGAMFQGTGATSIEALVKVATTGAGGVNGLTISGAHGNSLCGALLRVDQGSSGITENIAVAASVLAGATGSGIILNQTAGTLRDVNIGDTVHMAERATPISKTGTMSNIRVSPAVALLAGETFNFFKNCIDDEIWVIDLGKSFFTAAVEITSGSTRHGLFTVRAASSPTVSANRITDALVVAAAIPLLLPTDGVDGSLTLGVQDKTLTVLNRLNATQNIGVSVRAV